MPEYRATGHLLRCFITMIMIMDRLWKGNHRPDLRRLYLCLDLYPDCRRITAVIPASSCCIASFNSCENVAQKQRPCLWTDSTIFQIG